MTEKWLTTKQIAERLGGGISPRTVTGWCRSKILLGMQLPNGEWRVRQEDFDAWVQSRMRGISA